VAHRQLGMGLRLHLQIRHGRDGPQNGFAHAEEILRLVRGTREDGRVGWRIDYYHSVISVCSGELLRLALFRRTFVFMALHCVGGIALGQCAVPIFFPPQPFFWRTVMTNRSHFLIAVSSAALPATAPSANAAPV